MIRLFAAMFAVLLAVSTTAFGTANAQVRDPAVVQMIFTVRRLPDSSVVDMSRPLPTIPSAKVEVVELGVSRFANRNGEVTLFLKPGTYTFRTTLANSAHVSTLKQEAGEGRFSLFFDDQSDLTMDYSAGSRLRAQPSAPGPMMPAPTDPSSLLQMVTSPSKRFRSNRASRRR